MKTNLIAGEEHIWRAFFIDDEEVLGQRDRREGIGSRGAEVAPYKSFGQRP